jgi:hypothetical protein
MPTLPRRSTRMLAYGSLLLIDDLPARMRRATSGVGPTAPAQV